MSTQDWAADFHRPLSASGEVAAHLEGLIRSGRFAAGNLLPSERELSTRLGVSRASVRDGIQELALKGMIERRPGRGSTVVGAGDRPQELVGNLSTVQRRQAEVVDLRHVCEPAVARRAAERATRVDLHRLESILAESHARLTPDRARELDEQFHAAIAAAAQNPLLLSLIEVAQQWLHPYRTATHSSVERRQKSIDGHRAILECIRRRDADGAEAAMRTHIDETAAYLGRPTPTESDSTT